MTNDLQKNEIAELGKQQSSVSKRQSFGDKYGGAPFAFIMRNPKMTPVALLILATIPLVVTAFILGLYFLGIR